jgi:hypothetical protein
MHQVCCIEKRTLEDTNDFMSWLTDNDIVDVEADFNIILLLMLKKLGLFPHAFAGWAREHDIPIHFWSF